MTCDPRLLSYYRDGGLSLDERYELETHLAVCSECTSTLRGLMRLAQVVRSMQLEPVPASLRTDVRRMIAEREQERRQPIPLAGIGRALAPAAVAAAVAVSALVTLRPGALDLASRSAPNAVTVQAPASQPGPETAPVASTTGSGAAVASVPKFGPGTVAGGPSVHVPVAASGAGSMPMKMADPVSVPEPIARLYGANQQVHDLLGAAYPGSRTVTLLEQSFQGGLAIWRSDTREIYVLQRDGNTWSVHPDTWRPGDRISVDVPPPPGALVPAAGFGTVWRSRPEIKSRLGWAVYEPRGSGGSIQTFEHGLIVWTPHGLLYVLSNDGRWRTFPDASPL
jgi:anti-sigma factor RsiW